MELKQLVQWAGRSLTVTAALGVGLRADVHDVGVPVQDLDVDGILLSLLEAGQQLGVVLVVPDVGNHLSIIYRCHRRDSRTNP